MQSLRPSGPHLAVVIVPSFRKKAMAIIDRVEENKQTVGRAYDLPGG